MHAELRKHAQRTKGLRAVALSTAVVSTALVAPAYAAQPVRDTWEPGGSAMRPSTASVTTVVLRPDADLRNRGWLVRPSGQPAWSVLDDAVTSPTPPTTSDSARSTTTGAELDVSMTEPELAGGAAAGARFSFHARTGADTRLRVRAVWRDDTTGSTRSWGTTYVAPRSAAAWRAGPRLSAPDMPRSAAELASLRLRFTALDGGLDPAVNGADATVSAAYVSLTLSTCPQAPPTLPAGRWPAACWRPYAPSSPFNRAIPASPRTLPNSAQIIARMKGDISARDYVGHLSTDPSGGSGEPTYYSRPSDPLFTLDCTKFGGACSIDGMSIRIPAGAVPEGGPGAAPTADRHMTIVDQASGWEYDLWQVASSTPLPATGGTLTFSWGGRSRIDGDGTAHEPAGQVGHGTASHFADLAGRVRAEELAAGRIDHALNIVVNCDSGSYVWPARASDQSCSALGLSTLDAPPMGAHLQLAMTPAQIDQLPIRSWKKVFLHAMAEYGMFIGDTGSQNLFGIETEAGNQYLSQGASDPWWSYGRSNWELYDPDGAGPIAPSYVAKLYNRPDDPDPRFDWMTNVWSHLRVLDPCVARASC